MLGLADPIGGKGYIMEPSLLSTIHEVTDPQMPILHKIFPGLRAMTQYVLFKVHLSFLGTRS